MPSAWAPLRHDTFRLAWIAFLGVQLMNWAQMVGAVDVIAAQSGSATLMALVQTATSLPAVALALPAGAIADLVDRATLLAVLIAAMAVAMGALAALVFTGTASPAAILALTLVLGAAIAVAVPAFASLTPDLVPPAELAGAVTLTGISIELHDGRRPSPAAAARRHHGRRPYNAQVRVRAHLPDGVRVGTVDKFQGQEAAVAFFSMATSSGAELPRNLESLPAAAASTSPFRGRSLAALVCSPELLHVRHRSAKEMRLVNALSLLVEMAGEQMRGSPLDRRSRSTSASFPALRRCGGRARAARFVDTCAAEPDVGGGRRANRRRPQTAPLRALGSTSSITSKAPSTSVSSTCSAIPFRRSSSLPWPSRIRSRSASVPS